jgi:hypothetical protein
MAKFQSKTRFSKSKVVKMAKSHSKHHVRGKKNRVSQTPDDLILKHIKAEYVFNVTGNLVIDDAEVATVVATPEAVETELTYKVGLTEEESKESKYTG